MQFDKIFSPLSYGVWHRVAWSFHIEDGGVMFLWNAGIHSRETTMWRFAVLKTLDLVLMFFVIMTTNTVYRVIVLSEQYSLLLPLAIPKRLYAGHWAVVVYISTISEPTGSHKIYCSGKIISLYIFIKRDLK